MLKRIFVLLLICTTIICGTACSKATYDIIEKDGKHYISFNTNVPLRVAELEGWKSSVSGFPGFDSIGQMKKKIESCDFDDRELAGIQVHCDDDGLVEIFDLNKLCDLRTPQGVTVRKIAWAGTSYEFKLTFPFSTSGYVHCGDPEFYRKQFLRYYVDYPYADPDARECWEEKIADRNATQITYQTDSGDFRVIKYEIYEKNRTLYVAEDYCLASYYGNNYESFTIPRQIYIFTKENNIPVTIRIGRPIERPSVEWLSSFGVTPYEG